MVDDISSVRIYIMGKGYDVPANLTIMKAMEYTGYKFIRGAGCRAGFCGSCSTLYRTGGSYKLQAALACQKVVENEMYIATIPFTPSSKKIYDVDKLGPSTTVLHEYYPEIARCLSCNTCTKACPQDLEVMDYVQAAIRGELEEVSNLSFDCISCGLCAVRCPAEIVPYDVAQLARRLYAKYLRKGSKDLQNQLNELKSGKFDIELQNVKKLRKEELGKMYESMHIEEE